MDIDDLSRQIITMYEEVKETDETFTMKTEVWMLLNTILEDEVPEAKLVCFGSTVTRMCLEGGDMDIVLLIDSEEVSHLYKVDVLGRIKWRISKIKLSSAECFFTDFELLSGCFVPLLKFKAGFLTKKSGSYIQVELSVSQLRSKKFHNSSKRNNDVQNGTRNTHLLICYNNLFKRHSYPILNVLGVILKYWASHHSLLGNYYHRISSYGLYLMLIFYLQQQNVLPCLQEEYPELFATYEPVLIGSRYTCEKQQVVLEREQKVKQNINIGNTLIGFLEYFGNFDYNLVISVRTGKLLNNCKCADYADSEISRDSAREWFREVLIEDPIYRYNVARATSDMNVAKKIIETFKISGNVLKETKNLKDIFAVCSDT